MTPPIRYSRSGSVFGEPDHFGLVSSCGRKSPYLFGLARVLHVQKGRKKKIVNTVFKDGIWVKVEEETKPSAIRHWTDSIRLCFSSPKEKTIFLNDS